MARTINYREAISEALAQEMDRDQRVVVMGEDVAGGAGAPGDSDAWGGVMGRIGSPVIAINVQNIPWVCTVALTSGRARRTAVCMGVSEEGLYLPSNHFPLLSTIAISSSVMVA